MKNCKRKAIILCVFLMTFLNLPAQEMLGIVNSNYSGIHGALINPSSLTNSRYYLDINFLTIGLSAENNYLYLPKNGYKFSRFLGKYNDFPLYGPDNLPVTHFDNNNSVNEFAIARLMGPSAMLNIGKHAFGITTGIRTMTSVRNVPHQLADLLYQGLDDPPQFGINYPVSKKFAAAALGWAELGLSYAYVFRQSQLEYWSGGMTVKRLWGYSGGYTYVNNIDYTVYKRDAVTIYNISGETGYSLPVDYSTSLFLRTPLFRGHGYGFDIGVTYQKMKKEHQDASYRSVCAEAYKPYKYRIGISIIDIGSISFKKNAQRLVFKDPNPANINFLNIIRTTIDPTVRNISSHFYNDTAKLLQGNSIKVGLPTALSVQMDINYTGNWYINGILIYPLMLRSAGIARPGQLAVTPRYETDHFEVDLPVSMYDFKRPRIGISMRLYFLTIGTDKLGGFFNLSDFTGMDFYMALKWNFLKGHCHEKRKTNNGSCVGFN